MESKKARKFIECEHFEGTTMNFSSVKIFARTAIEEAEKELTEKAINAHIRSCELYHNDLCTGSEEKPCRRRDCRNVKYFINQLNN